jgi:hypothetical protein
MRAGYSVRFEPVEAAQRAGVSKIRLGWSGSTSLIPLKVITIFSPLRIFAPVSAAAFFLAPWRRVDDRHAVARHELVSPADTAERSDTPGWPRLRADFLAAHPKDGDRDGTSEPGPRW